jgi:hypothetical protein
MFSIKSEIDMDEMDAARRVASPFLKERGRVRLGLRQVASNSFAKWCSSARIPLILFLSPSARGEATKRTRVGICGACFHEK